MDRRDALRAITALATGTLATACTEPARRPPGDVTAASRSASPPRAAARAVEISHGPRNSGKVALTFHGQGDAVLADRLLTELATGGARVTVLAVGTWLAAQPELAARMLTAGHELGNHTQHHADLKQMSAAQVHAEIDECARVLRSATGSIGRWFRPSRTRHATDTIRTQAAKVGYATCLSYDVDSLDYTDPPPATIVGTTLGAVRGGSIVSLHLGHENTIKAMAPLLAGLQRRGLSAVTVTDLTG